MVANGSIPEGVETVMGAVALTDPASLVAVIV
jgi:hypothetical protein